MEQKENNKNKWLHLRLSEAEHRLIHQQFRKTTCRKLSEYARKKLLGKPLTVRYRNQSLDDLMAAFMQLQSELNALGRNFNQAVRKLNAMQPDEQAGRFLPLWEQDKKRLLEQVDAINNVIQQYGEQWLQGSTQTTR